LEKAIRYPQEKGEEWEICFAALEDIRIENDKANLEAITFQYALKMVLNKKK
jgi:hypothetical protein